MTSAIIIILLVCVLVNAQNDKKVYFWHLTDFHYDPSYWSQQWSCNEVVSDPGMFGDYRCDAPERLITSVIKALVYNGREPEFVVWSGDLLPHFKDPSDRSLDLLLETTRNITQILNATFQDIPILPVLGNHDYIPKDELPGGRSSIYETYAELWAPWFNDTEVTQKFIEGGFYSKRLKPHVLALVPNTNLYNKNNPLYIDDGDPGDQYQWMMEQLMAARANRDTVYMFLHMPPGMSEQDLNANLFHPYHNQHFVSILENYADVITAVFAGHTHLDTFKMIYKQGQPLSTIFISPSITPWQKRLKDNKVGPAHNPGIRKIWMWESNYTVEDMEQYYLDLPRANDVEEDIWRFLYSFKLMYRIPDASPGSVQLVLDNFKESSELFDKYYELLTVSSSVGSDPCGCLCKSRHLCAIQYLDITQYQDCIDESFDTCSGSFLKIQFWILFIGILSPYWID